MLAFVLLVVIATLIVSLRLTPIYESTVTIDIDRRMPTGVLGEESAQVSNNDADQFLATQIKIIQSDSVLRRWWIGFRFAKWSRRRWKKPSIKAIRAARRR